MQNMIDPNTEQRYRDIAAGKEPKAIQKDLKWITPTGLYIVGVIALAVTIIVNDVFRLI